MVLLTIDCLDKDCSEKIYLALLSISCHLASWTFRGPWPCGKCLVLPLKSRPGLGNPRTRRETCRLEAVVAERMLVTAFVLHTFTSKSSGRWWILTLHATQERKNKESEWRVRLYSSVQNPEKIQKVRNVFRKWVFAPSSCTN